MEDMATLVAALNATWFGSGLPPETQTRLAGLARRVETPAGTVLLTEGEVAEEFAILLGGRIALRTLVPERGMVTILTIEPGDVWGWSAIVPPYRATSTVVAIEPIDSLVFEGASIRIALRETACSPASCTRASSRRSPADSPRPVSSSSTCSHATRRPPSRAPSGRHPGMLSSELARPERTATRGRWFLDRDEARRADRGAPGRRADGDRPHGRPTGPSSTTRSRRRGLPAGWGDEQAPGRYR